MQGGAHPRFGGTEVLRLEQVPVPRPGDDEVLVRVAAASVNPVDYKIRQGHYPALTKDALPVTLGRDLSGVVEDCGPRAHAFKPGDPVYAMLSPDRGAYCDYVAAKPSELAPMPDGIDHATAAAVPLAGLTA